MENDIFEENSSPGVACEGQGAWTGTACPQFKRESLPPGHSSRPCRGALCWAVCQKGHGSRDVPSGWGRSEGVLRLRKETGRTGEVEGKREGLSVAPARQSGADVVKRVVRKEADRRQPRVSTCEQLEKL